MANTGTTSPEQLRAIETIEEIIEKLTISKNHLSEMIREDVNYLRTRLDRLEYLITPKAGMKIEPLKKPPYQTCFSCGTQISTGYYHLGRWYCPTHFPDGVTFPIGMHGEEFKVYQERKK